MNKEESFQILIKAIKDLQTESNHLVSDAEYINKQVILIKRLIINHERDN